jgi:hypothetical protein
MNVGEPWDTERAAELAQTAYRYVASVYPQEVGYALLDKYTDAAHEAQDAGDLLAFKEALRELMRAAARESRRRAA